MRLLASESYNVAWFKLADFIARGEKERALSVHKLLMHSVKDQALSYQLEGDILLSFDDDAALDRYHIAANLYKKSGQLKQAVSIYEHVCMYKRDEKILEALLDVYVLLMDYTRMQHTFEKFAKVCLEKQNMGFLINQFHKYLLAVDKATQAQLSVTMVQALLKHDAQSQQLTSYIHHAIDSMKDAGYGKGSREIKDFLQDIKTENKVEYKKVEQYIQRNF